MILVFIIYKQYNWIDNILHMILENFEQFMRGILQNIEALGVDVTSFQLDHVGYQASTDEDYDRLRVEFDKLGNRVSEEIVGGRRVGIYELQTPLTYKQYVIPAIELVAPKEGQVCPSALEHVEFVITGDFQSFMKKYPNIKWDATKINQPMFPMITLKLTGTTQVKFHLTPVLDIIKGKII